MYYGSFHKFKISDAIINNHYEFACTIEINYGDDKI